jgi:hypothetical protein
MSRLVRTEGRRERGRADARLQARPGAKPL